MKILLVCLLALPLSAQTAKVIQLSDDDAKQAKYYHDAVAAAQLAEDIFRDKVKVQYTQEDQLWPTAACVSSFSVNGHPIGQPADYNCPPAKPLTPEEKKAATHREYKTGWLYGFDYSEDFKFIVPKVANSYQAPTPCLGMGCYLTQPLSGPAWYGTNTGSNLTSGGITGTTNLIPGLVNGGGGEPPIMFDCPTGATCSVQGGLCHIENEHSSIYGSCDTILSMWNLKGVSFTDFNRQWEGPHLSHRMFTKAGFAITEGH